MSRNKRLLITFVFIGLFVLVGYIIFVYSFVSTSVPTKLPTFPTSIIQSGSTKYTQGSMTKMQNIYAHRQPLTPSGQQAREKLVNTTGGATGTIYSENDFLIVYDKPFDVFDAQILTANDLTGVKKSIINWFQQHGIEGSDICNLPLTYVLTAEADYALSQKGIVFNPVPDGC